MQFFRLSALDRLLVVVEGGIAAFLSHPIFEKTNPFQF